MSNFTQRLQSALITAQKAVRFARGFPRRFENMQRSIGRVEGLLLAQQGATARQHEFQVFSQNGEDGIIQWLIREIPIPNPIFVEFGVEDYSESNTRFLLQNNNWAGLVIDGSPQNVELIKRDQIYWRFNLKVDCAFIDRDNINSLLTRNGISGDIGLLSVDIDGNDYWVWEAINVVSPRIVVCEYNNTFGPEWRLTVPYDPGFIRSRAHPSNLYYGASIGALGYLARQKGYQLVAANSAGNNVFFVRADLAAKLPTLSPERAYVEGQFKEGLDNYGHPLPADRAARVSVIGDLPLIDPIDGSKVSLNMLADRVRVP
jgi:hypothetical protein